MEDASIVKYSDVFGINTISSTSEMALAIAFARALNRRGKVLSLDGVETDLSILDDNMRVFFDHAVRAGVISTSYDPGVDYNNTNGGSWWVSEDLIEHWDTIAPYAEENNRVWQFDPMKKELWSEVNKDLLLSKNMQYVLMSIVAEHLARVWVDGSKDTLIIKFNNNESEEGSNYLHILTAIEQNPNIGTTIHVLVDIAPNILDYMKYLHGSIQQRHNKKYSIEEKKKIAAHLGFVEGRVCVRWTRSRITRNSPAGIVDGRTLVIFNGFVDIGEGRTVVSYDTISEPKTYEERVEEFEEVPEKHQYLYRDLVKLGIRVRPDTSELYNVAFGNFIDDEAEFFLPLDTAEEVDKLVTVADADTYEPILKRWNMPAVDAIYWSLKQWDVPFDESLYISDNYPEGREPLYEQYSYEVVSK